MHNPTRTGCDTTEAAETMHHRGRRMHRRHDHGLRPDHGPEVRRRMRGGHRHGGGRGRAQRGDVRAAILLLLADEPMYGYQLMQSMQERTEGAWHPSPGAVYPTIGQLRDEGLVTMSTEGGGRKLATLTEAGRTYVAENKDTLGDPFATLAAEAGGASDLRSPVEDIHIAARQLARGGSDAQIAAAREILAQARRSLYLILAEDAATLAQFTGDAADS